MYKQCTDSVIVIALKAQCFSLGIEEVAFLTQAVNGTLFFSESIISKAEKPGKPCPSIPRSPVRALKRLTLKQTCHPHRSGLNPTKASPTQARQPLHTTFEVENTAKGSQCLIHQLPDLNRSA